jgi:hypothetical protein
MKGHADKSMHDIVAEGFLASESRGLLGRWQLSMGFVARRCRSAERQQRLAVLGPRIDRSMVFDLVGLHKGFECHGSGAAI